MNPARFRSAVDSEGRTIWIADAHRGDGKHFVARADEKLTALILSRISALFHSCYLLLHSAAKHHGIGNLMKRFFGSTHTADDDCAETRYATENALSNPMPSISLSRVSNEGRRIRPVLISTRLFVTANSEVRCSKNCSRHRMRARYLWATRHLLLHCFG